MKNKSNRELRDAHGMMQYPNWLYKSAKEVPEWICPNRGIVKTAWDTPEYLSDADWQFAQKVVDLCNVDDAAGLFALFDSDRQLKRNFFVKTIGYIEGKHYSAEYEWFLWTFFPGLKQHTVPRLQAALNTKGL
jgi:hypothetical protein